MPFDLVIEERTASGEEARVSKTSVCSSYGAIAGELRYFADRMGIPRAAIEGTQIPYDLIMKYATHEPPELVFDPHRKRVAARAAQPDHATSDSSWAARRSRSSTFRRSSRAAGPAENRGVARSLRGAASGGQAEPRGDRGDSRCVPAERRYDAAAVARGADGRLRENARGRALARRFSRGAARHRSGHDRAGRRTQAVARASEHAPPCATTTCPSSTTWRTERAASRGCACPRRWRARCTRVSSRRSIGRCASPCIVVRADRCVPRRWRSCRSCSTRPWMPDEVERERAPAPVREHSRKGAAPRRERRQSRGGGAARDERGGARSRWDLVFELARDASRCVSAESRTPLHETSRSRGRDSSAARAA